MLNPASIVQQVPLGQLIAMFFRHSRFSLGTIPLLPNKRLKLSPSISYQKPPVFAAVEFPFTAAFFSSAMRLFIAEKPSVAKAIATELGIVKKDGTSIVCQDDNVVTWCFGHLLEQAEPDYYLPDSVPKTKKGKKTWRMQDLPIFPTSVQNKFRQNHAHKPATYDT